jgi:nitroimidazol reductase NimA-like FMN-containing flavoprotein (pyridoxamine 5'-phosphate oxidase superfamily)
MAPTNTNKPVFATLTDEESWAVLSRNHLGRLAFMNASRVDIEPVSYVAADSWLFMRSAGGAKLDALAHSPYVAFEVDEVKNPFDWRSVVARGTIYLMSDDGRHVDHATVERAVEALRSFQPNALGDEDPTPFRRTVYGLHVDLVTGRKATLQTETGSELSAATSHERPARRRGSDGS